MNTKFKKTTVILGLCTLAVGISTSMSSFGVKSTAATTLSPCYDANSYSCAVSTNFLVKNYFGVNQAYSYEDLSATQFTITVGTDVMTLNKAPGATTYTQIGPETGTYFTISATPTPSSRTACTPRTTTGGVTCKATDCLGNATGTYNCPN